MKIHWPKIAIPEGFENAESYLSHLVYEGAKKRYADKDGAYMREINEKIDYELDFLTGFEPYFIFYYHLIEYCHSENILVSPGYGSAANSMVNYCLGITQIEPNSWLVFENFFLRGTDNFPDIDIVVEDARRDDLIQYLKTTYGEDCVLKAGVGYRPNFEKKRSERVPVYSVHASGICIFDKPYNEVTDTIEIESEDTNQKTIVPRMTMQELKSMGYICINILGMEKLTCISRCLKLIEQNKGLSINYDRIPNEDPATLEFLSSGHEDIGKIWCSNTLTEIFGEIKFTYMEDLYSINAIWCPALYENTYQFIYLMKADESAEIFEIFYEYFYELTRGLLLYREQIPVILSLLSDWDFTECERMRRYMRYPDYMPIKRNFLEGVKRLGLHDIEEAVRIWKYFMENHKKVVSLSHITCTTTMWYRASWFRVHYPEEFKECYPLK